MITLFFTELNQVKSYDDASESDTEKFGRYYRLMLEQGIYLPPSQFEAAFVVGCITNEEIDKTLDASLKALKQL